jgi:Kef-type K+ transport system membrane component KefB
VTPIQEPVFQFTLLIVAALLVQLTVERVRLPGLLGLLALGVALGPDATGLLPPDPIVPMLGRIGLIYVMFIAGIEIDLRVARAHRREVATLGVLAFGLSALAATGAGLALGLSSAAALLLGALIASHTLLAYPILVRLDLLHRVPVVAAVGGTLITDTLALALLAVVLGVHAANGVAAALLPLGLLALLVAAALYGVPRLSRRVFGLARVTPAEQALFVLAVVLLLASVAELIGTHEILGAFLAGLCLNRTLAERSRLREHVEFVGRMLFIPFFFIWTGTLLDVDVLLTGGAAWLMAGVLLALVVGSKGAAAWIAGAAFRYSRRERLMITSLTLPQAAATLAVTITARDAGLFDAVLVDAVVIVIFVTCLAGPLLTDRIGRALAQPTDSEAARPAMHEQVQERSQARSGSVRPGR